MGLSRKIVLDMTRSSSAHRPSAGLPHQTHRLQTGQAGNWSPAWTMPPSQHTLTQRKGEHRLFVTSYHLCCLTSKEIQNNWQTLFIKLFYSSSFFVGCVARHVGSQFPDQGPNSHPLHWKGRVLIAGPPGKSQQRLFLTRIICFQFIQNISE